MRASIFFFILILMGAGYGAPLAAENEKSRKNYLRWQPVEGAVSYAVNITDTEGKNILDTRVKEAEYYFNLKPGKYRVRIGAVNRFEQVVSWSDWSSLVIRPPVQPVIASVVPGKLPPATEKEVSIHGRNFIRGAKVFLQNDARKILPESCRVVEKDLVQCRVKIPPETEGNYRLVLVNPGGLRDTGDFTIARKSIVKEKLPGTAAAGEIYFTAGYRFVHVLGEWQTPLENGIIGAFLRTGITLDVLPFLRGVNFMDHLAVEMDFSYALFDSKERIGIVKSTMHQFLPGLYLAVSIPLPLGGFFAELRGGGGLALHMVVQEWTVFGAETTSTLDPLLGGGAALRFQWRGLSLFLGADYRLIFTGVNYFHSLSYHAGAGYRF